MQATKLPRFAAAVVGLLLSHFAFSQTWTKTSAPTNGWSSLVCSADGTKIVAAAAGEYQAGSIYSSTNSGASWIKTTAPAKAWLSLASSADGIGLYAGPGYVAGTSYSPLYRSTNAGSTWTPTSSPAGDWTSVACSADGREVLAFQNSAGVYLSTNFGTSWTKTAAASPSYGFIASSADATRFVALDGDGRIFSFVNNGLGGTTTNFTFLNQKPVWNAVASSSDGINLVATSRTFSPIFVSTNSGAAWSPIHQDNLVWYSVASSASGATMVAGGAGAVYTSLDFGMSWRSNSLPKLTWLAVACSADGNRLVAAASGGAIYISESTPHPKLIPTNSDSGLILSWTPPSIPFELQANTDLITTNWTIVSATPLLDIVSLRNYVVLPTTGNHAFYRLKAPEKGP